ncbi:MULTISPECIES: carbohydrate ABC transporter permease [Oscillospiraceae]|uniref:Multiple sugar transport system permease protein n=1 Tax=Harryflintia acetispora TaxID=1849041 RepID=A0A9X8Y8Z0_9FIRM|nr:MULTISPECIES: carbohydrate ABC transporter permease [Oscillospiraceae]TCL44593.1 multiple sugar transport system permease protein [Harryflintia acetispora]
MKTLRKALALLFPTLLSLTVWLPILLIVGGSFMGVAELLEDLGPVLAGEEGFARWSLLPQYPTLRPYVELLLDSPQFFVMFWNSVKLAGGILLGQLLVGAPAAWGFARWKGKLQNLLFTVYIVLMLMPFQVTMVSNYLVLDGLSLLDTHLGIILPAAFSTFPVFIMYRFFCGIPGAVLESASLDGANELQVFLYIGVPLGGAGIMSAMVLGFLEYWNMIEQPLTFLHERTLWPLSLFLPTIVADKAGLSLAASVITLLPAILIFMLGQRYLEAGIKAAGLKE